MVKTQTGSSQSVPELQSLLSSFQEQAKHLQSMIDTMEQKVREVTVKRGPGRPRKVPLDALPPLPAPPPPPKPLEVSEKIEVALTRESLDTQRLAKAIGETLEKTTMTLKELRDAERVYNVGFDDLPIWTWKVGNDCDAATLIKVIRRLISERPMFLRDLIRASGATQSRVSGALIEVQRMDRVIDLGGGGHAKQYFLIGERVRDASLPPKKFKGGAVKHGARRAAHEDDPEPESEG